MELRNRDGVAEDSLPREGREHAARRRSRVLRGLRGTRQRGADGDIPGAARKTGGARCRPGGVFRRNRSAGSRVFRDRRPDDRVELSGAARVGARPPGTGGRFRVCGGDRQPVPSRHGLADGCGRDAGDPDGSRRRRSPDRARRDDGREVRLPRAACPRGCGRERGHGRLSGRAKRDGVLAG